MKKTGFYLFVFIVLGLFLVNPQSEDYVQWAADELKKDQNKLVEIGVDLAVVPYLTANTARTDWFVFSIYKTKHIDGTVITTVGVVNNFIVISKK
ncbi:hypothetical protein [Alkalihalobacillus sp. CinArs1]|uniref:hypothetical protein n=1 Tax=Alkalihalobacillus sp. CinArs1 TaxID=2995314 RepID=UPI0022DDD2FC|nr:hypothetical protein [Alkalihalobacillus sp. CinArs1]